MKQMLEVSPGKVQCKRCGEIKLRKEFRPDKVEYTCKVCLSKFRQAERRTPRGLGFKTHATQRRNAKVRNHPAPNYTNVELVDWMTAQPSFQQLFDIWVAANYNRLLIPSCDRRDDSKSYTFDNLRLVSYRDNRDKYYQQKIKGTAYHTDSVPIYQYDMTGTFIKEFYSIAQAVRELGLISNAVSKVCKGTLNQHHGWVFRYKDEISSTKVRLTDIKHKRKPNKRSL